MTNLPSYSSRSIYHTREIVSPSQVLYLGVYLLEDKSSCSLPKKWWWWRGFRKTGPIIRSVTLLQRSQILTLAVCLMPKVVISGRQLAGEMQTNRALKAYHTSWRSLSEWNRALIWCFDENRFDYVCLKTTVLNCIKFSRRSWFPRKKTANKKLNPSQIQLSVAWSYSVAWNLLSVDTKVGTQKLGAFPSARMTEKRPRIIRTPDPTNGSLIDYTLICFTLWKNDPFALWST